MKILRPLLWFVFAAGMCALAAWAVLDRLNARALTRELPAVPRVSAERLFPRAAPIRARITVEWLKVPVDVFPEMIAADRRLWQRMHFDDWDTVPDPLRTSGLDAMMREHRHLLGDPRQWDRMTADHWDEVPQPIRAMAFMQMVRYWSGYYQVGATYHLPRGTVTDTLNAIVMAESWFEHRAISVSRSGNRDLGLGQASDYARAALAGLFRRKIIDFAPVDEAGYFNPWQATRMTAIWFDLMLHEQGGDLEAAVRAYHRGSRLVDSPAADAYLAGVVQRRRRYIRDIDSAPSWHRLMELARGETNADKDTRARIVDDRLAARSVPGGVVAGTPAAPRARQ